MIENNHEQLVETCVATDSEPETIDHRSIDVSWKDLAECNTADTSLFFPDQGASTKAAKAICNACIVREDCLEYALVYEKHGIWGGTSERERRRIRKARALAAAQHVTAVTIDVQ